MKVHTQNINEIELKERNPTSHKGDHGHALIIAGSKGLMGAALISAKACLRAGVGLLTLNIPEEERTILQIGIPEAILTFRAEERCDFTAFSSIGLGPGMGLGEASTEILSKVLQEYKKPILLDADALTILSTHKELFKSIPKNSIITPHPKEFDRLFGVHQNLEQRLETGIKKAKELHIIIVLKGHETHIISAHEVVKNTTGNAGLAKGGSGDAMTGIITAFLAQEYDPFVAAKTGVFIHGLAADIALENQSVESVLITDVIKCLGKAFCQIRFA
jgi:NAD(P)H-hydrate epimerase